MLPNDNVSMSVGHFDHVLIVYSSMEHMTWKSPGPMYGWVGKILHPDLCTSVSSWSKMPLLSIWSVAVPLCRPLCFVPVDDMVLFHGMVCDGWLVIYTALPCSGGSGLCTSCERVHLFLVSLDPQTKLPACLSNIWAEAVLARHTIDQFGLLRKVCFVYIIGILVILSIICTVSAGVENTYVVFTQWDIVSLWFSWKQIFRT